MEAATQALPSWFRRWGCGKWGSDNREGIFVLRAPCTGVLAGRGARKSKSKAWGRVGSRVQSFNVCYLGPWRLGWGHGPEPIDSLWVYWSSKALASELELAPAPALALESGKCIDVYLGSIRGWLCNRGRYLTWLCLIFISKLWMMICAPPISHRGQNRSKEHGALQNKSTNKVERVWSNNVTSWVCGRRSLGEIRAEFKHMRRNKQLWPFSPGCTPGQWLKFSLPIQVLLYLIISPIVEQICLPWQLSFLNYHSEFPFLHWTAEGRVSSLKPGHGVLPPSLPLALFPVSLFPLWKLN